MYALARRITGTSTTTTSTNTSTTAAARRCTTAAIHTIHTAAAYSAASASIRRSCSSAVAHTAAGSSTWAPLLRGRRSAQLPAAGHRAFFHASSISSALQTQASPQKSSRDRLTSGRRLVATPGKWSTSTSTTTTSSTSSSRYPSSSLSSSALSSTSSASSLYNSPGARASRAAAAAGTATSSQSTSQLPRTSSPTITHIHPHNSSYISSTGPTTTTTTTTTSPSDTPNPNPTIRQRMQITSAQFDAQRPAIIDKLRKSLFVSFDLEFSGIGKPKDGTRQPFRTKQTLQEAYLGMKEGVERYQVLQLGLCPVEWDDGKGEYIASPINIYVSPIVPNQNLNVDRVFSLQGSALEFLMDHGFDFNKQLRNGVPYLSREEERRIRETHAAEDEGRREMAPIEPSSQEFADDCIKALEDWESDPDAPWDFLNITSTNNTLTSYQRLIVHQIVRSRFPALTTTTRGTFICVTRTTAQLASKRKAEFEATVDAAIGLRHVIDELFCPNREDGRKIVLVGHNCLVDLMHIYHCFVGALPDRVEEFAEVVNRCFPIVIDTKYLATHNNHTSNANSLSTLQLLWATLSGKSHPAISCHPEHNTYSSGNEAYHEAGYDALLTAQVMLRLAGELSGVGVKIPGFYDEEVVVVGDADAGKKAKRQKMDDEGEFGEGMEVVGEEESSVIVNGFWRRYVNRLRVFMTEKGEVVLRPQEVKVEVGGGGNGVNGVTNGVNGVNGVSNGVSRVDVNGAR